MQQFTSDLNHCSHCIDGRSAEFNANTLDSPALSASAGSMRLQLFTQNSKLLKLTWQLQGQAMPLMSHLGHLLLVWTILGSQKVGVLIFVQLSPISMFI